MVSLPLIVEKQIDKKTLSDSPWSIIAQIPTLLLGISESTHSNFLEIQPQIWVHQTSTIEKGAILKPPLLIDKNCFIASYAYLRGGVILGDGVTIGPSTEVKTSIIGSNTSLAHFNFIGDSLIGENVNFEAGAVVANHFNERTNKQISVIFKEKKINTKLIKLGTIVGDFSRIGANAVLNPGSILQPGSIVDRLAHFKQL